MAELDPAADNQAAEFDQAAQWHRQVVALTTAAHRAGVGGPELLALQSRLLVQQARFGEVARQDGASVPRLTPTPSEVATAGGDLGDLSAEVVGTTFALASSTLDAADAALASLLGQDPDESAAGMARNSGEQSPAASAAPPTLPPFQTGMRPPSGQFGQVPLAPPTGWRPDPRTVGPSEPEQSGPSGLAGWPSALRNGFIYGGYTLIVFMIEAALFFAAGEQRLAMVSPLCLLVLPALAWGAGWITVGAAFRGDSVVDRTPRLGAAICLLPNLLICGGLAVLVLNGGS